MAVRRYAIFPLFAYADPGGAFSPYRLETWLDCTYLAEFLIFFTKKGPGNIAASRLKIGRTYAPLQPFKAKLCWNLNRLFWPLLRRRRTFAPLRLTSQISLFQLEFSDDFRTQGRAYTHVSAEL